MKILITGGAGFIASHIGDAYIGLGHDVVVLDNLSSGMEKNLNPKARLVKGDIRDADLVKDLFAKERFDAVNHHAAQMDVRRSVDDPVFDASVNLLGALTLFEQCVKTGVKKVIFASSGGAMYGEQDFFPADETHPTRPISPYGVAKATTESYLFYYKAVHGLDSVSLRYANIYGPRQNPHGEAGVVAIFCSKLLAGQQPIINGEGKQTRDYVFVADVVRANVMALNYKGFNAFNVGTGVETDVNKLFNVINDAIGSGAKEEHGPAKMGEQMRSVLSHGKIKSTLGWQPEVTVEEGLKRTVDFFRRAKTDASAR
jgi:UDP-glucose 4-epimerase